MPGQGCPGFFAVRDEFFKNDKAKFNAGPSNAGFLCAIIFQVLP
jgi:hypothetical protein